MDIWLNIDKGIYLIQFVHAVVSRTHLAISKVIHSTESELCLDWIKL